MRLEVSRRVIWRWRVVWGEKGRGMARWVGWRVGDAVSDIDGSRGGDDGGRSIMRGMVMRWSSILRAAVDITPELVFVSLYP